ncbi:hypothetical protein LR48_Vigan08g086100 [Vigna angularis]|uniref:Uncharacterized protein n=1 Tax=Phaseolus angularis TaxID=3914 RepID=A0A0L9V5U5_PHAAN|nr:hypothetical protein LR48_Vigan08g086100 [Vigna angularis]
MYPLLFNPLQPVKCLQVLLDTPNAGRWKREGCTWVAAGYAALSWTVLLSLLDRVVKLVENKVAAGPCWTCCSTSPLQAAGPKANSFLVAEQVVEGNASARIHLEFPQWFGNQSVGPPPTPTIHPPPTPVVDPTPTTTIHPSPTLAVHHSPTPAADPLPPPVIITPTPPPMLITPTPTPDPTSIPSSSCIAPSKTIIPSIDPDSAGDSEGVDPPLHDRPWIEPYGKGFIPSKVMETNPS